jgi:hypothetical protein
MAAPVIIATAAFNADAATTYDLWTTSTAGVYAASVCLQPPFADDVTVRWWIGVFGENAIVYTATIVAGDNGLLTPPIPVTASAKVDLTTGTTGTGAITWEVIGT